ncbi:MAG TPA: tRNA (adenine-N1)-methyltransferase [archaeon]|nr:tRNA (adenine-N1)-methyltransferase [archaeon]
MKEKELVLLLSKDSSFVVEVKKGMLHTKDGIVDLGNLKKKKFGDKIKTHLGKEFKIVKPTINDILEKKLKRLPQIIMPKDIALILAYTGISSGSLIVDAGTGSGFLSIFLASYAKPKKIVTYENDKRFVKIAKDNIRNSGLSKIVRLKQKDITKGIDEKNVDLVTLDMKNSEKVVRNAYSVLRLGGYLVVYSPYIEQVISVVKEMERKGFSNIKTVENIVREWQVEKFTRPKTVGLMHTGFLTFARKV